MGSSSTRTGRSASRTRAIPIRWCSPPDTPGPIPPRRVSRPSGRFSHQARSPARRSASVSCSGVASGRATRRFWRRVLSNRWAPGPHHAIRPRTSSERRSRASTSSTDSAPPRTSSVRMTAAIRVLFPEPEGPLTARCPPARRSRSRSVTASRSAPGHRTESSRAPIRRPSGAGRGKAGSVMVAAVLSRDASRRAACLPEASRSAASGRPTTSSVRASGVRTSTANAGPGRVPARRAMTPSTPHPTMAAPTARVEIAPPSPVPAAARRVRVASRRSRAAIRARRVPAAPKATRSGPATSSSVAAAATVPRVAAVRPAAARTAASVTAGARTPAPRRPAATTIPAPGSSTPRARDVPTPTTAAQAPGTRARTRTSCWASTSPMSRASRSPGGAGASPRGPAGPASATDRTRRVGEDPQGDVVGGEPLAIAKAAFARPKTRTPTIATISVSTGGCRAAEEISQAAWPQRDADPSAGAGETARASGRRCGRSTDGSSRSGRPAARGPGPRRPAPGPAPGARRGSAGRGAGPGAGPAGARRAGDGDHPVAETQHGARWLTTTALRPASTAGRVRRSAASVAASRPSVGSSSSSSGRSASSARARATRRCWPVDRRSPRSRTSVATGRSSARSAAAAAGRQRGIGRAEAEVVRDGAADEEGPLGEPGDEPSHPARSSRPGRGRPRSPGRGRARASPAAGRAACDFPAPLGPAMPRTSPGARSSETAVEDGARPRRRHRRRRGAARRGRVGCRERRRPGRPSGRGPGRGPRRRRRRGPRRSRGGAR